MTDNDSECTLCGGSVMERDHAMSGCPGSRTPAELAHLPRYARSYIDEGEVVLIEDAELRETDRAAQHFARGVLMLAAENERLRARQEELLALVAKLSQTVPLESEVSEALAHRGVLLAEVGSLRAQIDGLRMMNASNADRLDAVLRERDSLRRELKRLQPVEGTTEP